MDSSPGIRGSLTALGRAGLAVTAATAAANLLAYLPPALGARRLAPADLGALAAALALVAIATMPGIGLQTAVAVAVARAGGKAAATRASGPGSVARQAWLTALMCGGVVLLAAPVLAVSLRLPVGVPPMLAAMTVPAVLAGWPLGVLQGGERFGRLAVGTVALAFGRYAGVLVGLVAGLGLTGTFALGALAAWLVPPTLSWLLRANGTASLATALPDAETPGIEAAGVTSSATEAAPGALRGRAVFAAASASLAILVASYADLILARRLLPPGESGAYAVGAVLTRAAIWGPQVVTIVALPRLVRGGAALRVGLALVVAAGAALVGGAAVAGDLLVRAVGGDGYARIGELAPYFVLVGALYAVTVFFINALIADRARRPAVGVWAVVAGLAIVAAIVRPGTVGELLACAVGAAAASALVTGAAVWRRKRPALA
ncbi:polysaccharide biosynthesis protein [Actinoplanes sp. CA-142083]|uniref:polysaccharide biosynthesis protein n=1 Tax=Actinoplanes sp. CA-142083 TaxID=3239903 RepID=UPI003D8AFD98